jgi:hypothetical protein
MIVHGVNGRADGKFPGIVKSHWVGNELMMSACDQHCVLSGYFQYQVGSR